MDLNYTVVRSPRRRKLTITVERDRTVVVHAPEATSEEKIRQVVEAKRQWIFEKTRYAQKYDDLAHWVCPACTDRSELSDQVP